MSELFTLCCWIRGHPAEFIFVIETSPGERVGAIKQKIKDSGGDTLRNVAPVDLRLYKLNTPVPFHGLSAVTLSVSGEPLPNALKISDIFVTQLLECHIHPWQHFFRAPMVLQTNYHLQGKLVCETRPLASLATIIQIRH